MQQGEVVFKEYDRVPVTPVTLTVAEARYLMTRYYRPFLLSGTRMVEETDKSVFVALNCYIQWQTSKARFEELNTRIHTPNTAGLYLIGQHNTNWAELNNEVKNNERFFYAHKNDFDTFMKKTGNTWLEEARAARVRL